MADKLTGKLKKLRADVQSITEFFDTLDASVTPSDRQVNRLHAASLKVQLAILEQISALNEKVARVMR
jgi:hypothetical protein